MKIFGIDEQEEVCANCKHYVQHWVKTKYREGLSPCNTGHCLYPRKKLRKPGETCEHFEFGNWEDKYTKKGSKHQCSM